MKPAEFIAIAAAVPMVVALIAAEVADSRVAPAPTAVATEAAPVAATPEGFGEIVVVAKRLSKPS